MQTYEIKKLGYTINNHGLYRSDGKCIIFRKRLDGEERFSYKFYAIDDESAKLIYEIGEYE